MSTKHDRFNYYRSSFHFSFAPMLTQANFPIGVFLMLPVLVHRLPSKLDAVEALGMLVATVLAGTVVVVVVEAVETPSSPLIPITVIGRGESGIAE
jgi:hypothetical protein